MNNKIPIKIFAEKLAEECGVSPEDAQKFIKLYFETVAKKLRNGETVTVGGLGAFSLTLNPDAPVIFTPCEEAAAEVNSPFDMFEPMELPQGVNEADLDASAEPDTVEVTESIDTPDPMEIAEFVEEPEADTADEPEKTQPVESIVDVVSETISEVAEPAVMKEMAQHAPEAVAEMPEQIVATEQGQELHQYQEPEQDAESIDCLPEDEEEYVPVVADKGAPSFGMGFLVGILTGLIIGAVALYLYVMYYVNTPTA